MKKNEKFNDDLKDDRPILMILSPAKM